MKKYKLKLFRMTRVECVIICSLLLLISCVVALYPVANKKDFSSSVDNKVETRKEAEVKGNILHKTTFDDKYSFVITDDSEISHYYVNEETNEIVDYMDFVKDEYEQEFNEKIRELLHRKYPGYIVDLLWHKAKNTYEFYDEYLMIYYDTLGLIDTQREFNLKVYYVEIDKYLEFDTKKALDAQSESGFNYDKNKVSIAFTFDDGPNGEKTRRLIDSFEDYKMSATFFVVGYKMENDADTLKKIASSHSEIGYHSFNHSYFTKQTAAQIQSEYTAANDILKQITGKEFRFTRPPYGSYNANTLAAIDNTFIYWDLDTNDWRYKDVDYIVNYVLDNYKDGSIILFHDSYETSIEAAIKLMNILYLRDVQVVSVSTLAELKDMDLETHEIYRSFRK